MTLHRLLAPGLTAVRVLALAAVVAVPVVLRTGAGDPGEVTRSLAGDRVVLSQQVLERLDCSTSEPDGPGAGPTALVRLPSGEVRHVPFARGWASYTGRRPGDLVAVCLSPVGR